jgi:hypothetical protein
MGAHPLASLFVPMLVAWSLLVTHSVLERGVRQTVQWFGCAVLYGLAREVLVGHTVPVYRFPVEATFQVALLVAIGWSFAFYLGDMVASEYLRGIGPEGRPRMLPESMKASIATGVTGATALSIEAVAVGVGWWSWVPAVRAYNWMVFPIFTDIPLFVIPGWAWGSFTFLLTYDFVNDPRRAARYGKWRFLMLILIPAQLAGIVWGNWLFTNVWGPS